jgi:hypothetical protein
MNVKVNPPRRAAGEAAGPSEPAGQDAASAASAAPVPTPMPEPAGGWPRDEFTGQAGRFVRDPFTGIRSRADEPATAPAATPPADGQ